MTAAPTTIDHPGSPVRRLLPGILPALVVGVLSALVLIALSSVSSLMQKVWWTTIPDAMGIDGTGKMWTVIVLTAMGILVALCVVVMPGHAGPDPSTTSLVDAPLKLSVLPGLVLATILTLSGGVSLGPENPIMAINAALILFLGSKMLPKSTAKMWVSFAVAGTLGAMFGTAVAAALCLSEMLASNKDDEPAPLWDKLVLPLFAAGAGSVTMLLIDDPVFSLGLPAYPGFQIMDLLTGSIVAAAAAGLGLLSIVVFPLVHKAFAALRHQWIALPIGGLVLGLLGALGGQVTLFKGFEQMKELAADAATYTGLGLLGLAVIKLAALLIASSAGFRGGRIFPALFVGVAFGLAAHAMVPSIPVTLAVAAASLGILLAVTRQGWLSIFMVLVTIPDLALIPVIAVIVLPAWLIVTGRKELLIPRAQAIPV